MANRAYKLNIKGKSYQVDIPEDYTQEQVHQQMERTRVEIAEGVYGLNPVSRSLHSVGRQIIEGGKDIPRGIAGMAELATEMPGMARRFLGQLGTDPMGAMKGAGQAAGQLAVGAIPMQDTIRYMGKAQDDFPGPNISPFGVAYQAGKALGMPEPMGEPIREATSNLLGFRLGKFIPETAERLVKGAVGPRSKIPGAASGAAVELHSMHIPVVKQLAEDLRPTDAAVAQAFTDLENAGGAIPIYHMGEFRSAAGSMRRELLSLSNPPQEMITELDNYLRTSHNGWTFDQVQAEARDLGQKLGSTPKGMAEGQARAAQNRYRELLASLHGDIDAGKPAIVQRTGAAAVAGQIDPAMTNVATLDDTARNLARRQFATNTLQKYIDDAVTTVGDQHEGINVNRILNNIRKARAGSDRGDRAARLFARSFNPGELNAIESTLQSIARDLPPIPKGRMIPVGSSQRLMQTVIGRGIGSMFGHAEIGTMAGVALPEIVANALMSDPGRKLVSWAYKMDPSIGPGTQQILAAFLRSQTAQVTGAQGRPTVPSMMRSQTPEPTPSPTPDPRDMNTAKDIQSKFKAAEGK